MIKYKVDILEALKKAGYTTYRIRKEKILGQKTLQDIRTGKIVNDNNLNILCNLLNCQPGDLIEFAPDKE